MTSIVITPFDSEHTEELKEFLWKVIERADFADCMPPSVRLVDVQALEAQRDRLLADLRSIADTLRDHPDVNTGSTRVHYAFMKAKGVQP
jgi:hypothetical protein